MTSWNASVISSGPISITWCWVPSSSATWRWKADSSKSGSRKASENVRSWWSVCSTASAVVRLESRPPER